jgi:hypothetical protein
MSRIIGGLGIPLLLLLTGCSSTKITQDYTNYHQSNPKSILVLPPENYSPEVKAGPSLLTQVTYPLAEAGYYVFPVALVEETFRQNGLTTPHDIRAASATKMQQIFGADALLYLDVKEYGSQYQLIRSETRVTAEAKLIDLNSGKTLWSGSATASSNEQSSGMSGGGLIGILVTAAIDQIAHTLMNKGHEVAGVTACRLLSAARPNGILYGPRSPHYGQDKR